MVFKKLTIDEESKTKICAGHTQFTVQQLENEIKAGSEIGIKLKSVEKILEENY